jgi:hypothetical protein
VKRLVDSIEGTASMGIKRKRSLVMKSIVLGTGFALVCGISVAFAQSTNTSPAQGNNSSGPSTAIASQNANAPAKLQQQVQQNLSKAGFSDIKIMPESFLVRAKDPSGNPIMMVINPDSVTAVTYSSGNASNQSSQNGNSVSTRTTPGISGLGR